MRLLPFMDVPLISDEEPSAIDRYADLLVWANGDRMKMSAGFLAHDNEGEVPEDYLFQIAYIKEECLVTNESVIKYVGNQCNEYKKWKEEVRLQFEIQAHLELYYMKINIVPPWGTSKYRELQLKGFTPRTLVGPHKAGGLRPNQRRLIILDASNNIIFGPMLS